MQFTNAFISLVLATAVVAKGGRNSTRVPSDKQVCGEINRLDGLVKLVANETRLEAKTRNNTERITKIKAEAVKAQTQLTTLQQNATLVATCAVIDAAQKTEKDCRDLEELPKFIAFAGNATLINRKGAKGNQTKRVEKAKAEAAKAQTKLDGLKANTTLAATCTEVEAKAKADKAAKKAAKEAKKAGKTATLSSSTAAPTSTSA